jgi:cytochrome P450
LAAANQKEHVRIRKLLAPAFSDSSLLEQEPLLNHYFDLLIAKLKQQIDGPSNGRVDLMTQYNFVTFDIIRHVIAWSLRNVRLTSCQ